MKKKMINTVHLEGLVYEHDLALKTTGPQSKNPGTQYITGTVSIATDDACVNIVPVHYTFASATTSAGTPNASFALLKDIAEGKIGTVMGDGKANAAKVRVDTALALNEFYSARDGEETLVSVKRNEGGFIHKSDMIASNEAQRNTFECDMLITKVSHIDADDEKGTPEKAIVKGAIFDFRKSLLPVEFSVVSPSGIDYFEGLQASSTAPVFTKIYGQQICEVTVRKYEEETAFGEPRVREVQSSRKDFVIVNAAKEPYEWDTESTLTAMEVKEMLANREVALATMKQKQDEYKASKNASSSNDGFNF